MFDRFLLFIFRTKIIFDLIILVVISSLSYFIDESYGDPFVFTTTILIFCYISYFEFLKNQKNRIYFFYNAKTIKKLRIYTLISCIRISLIFIPISFIMGILSNNITTYFLHYIFAMSGFSIANYIVSINIEKRKNGTIITIKNLLDSVAICILTILLLLLISKYFFKSL